MSDLMRRLSGKKNPQGTSHLREVVDMSVASRQCRKLDLRCPGAAARGSRSKTGAEQRQSGWFRNRGLGGTSVAGCLRIVNADAAVDPGNAGQRDRLSGEIRQERSKSGLEAEGQRTQTLSRAPEVHVGQNERAGRLKGV